MYSFSDRSSRKLSTCHKDLQKIASLAIMISEVDFGISEGHRPVSRQLELYSKGRTKPGDIVTYVDGIKKKSKHNFEPSLAFDVFAWIDGRVSWEPDYYRKISEAMKDAADTFDLPLTWGGDWESFKDYPHFEL